MFRFHIENYTKELIILVQGVILTNSKGLNYLAPIDVAK
jgi:hypothetical protein